MSIPTSSKAWILNKKLTGEATWTGDNPNFKIVTKDLPALEDKQVLVKVIFLSNDPAQRTWVDAGVDPERMYYPPVPEGDVMNALGVGEVIESKSDKFKKGQTVMGGFGWTEYIVLNEDTPRFNPVQELPGGLSPSHYLGALGLTGLTAYYGLVIIAEAKKGESILVSGAAGATGSMVVQIAKHIVGASKVIGIAGTDDKCKWVESIGADKCLNYKSPDFEKELKAVSEGGYEVYFDNVGGHILDLSFQHLKKYGRVAACGSITGYNSGFAWESKNFFNVISMRLQIRGFIVTDWMPKTAETIGIFRKALEEGKLKLSNDNETVVDTKFEDIPKTWMMLFEGGNTGKLVTKLP